MDERLREWLTNDEWPVIDIDRLAADMGREFTDKERRFLEALNEATEAGLLDVAIIRGMKVITRRVISQRN